MGLCACCAAKGKPRRAWQGHRVKEAALFWKKARKKLLSTEVFCADRRQISQESEVFCFFF
jgi:hypothetical protein